MEPAFTLSFEPWVVLCLVSSATLYGVGVARLWRHARPGRGVRPGEAAAFAAGWCALVLALVSPLDAWSERSFGAHMIQHEVLMIVAAPLLVLSRPLAAFVWALPQAWRRAVGAAFRAPAWRMPWRGATGPVGAWLAHAAAVWFWHAPMLFDAALKNEGVHAVQHLSFFLPSLVFWWSVLGPHSRARAGVALLSLFTTMAHTGALGALLTFASRTWYAYPAAGVFGLDPLEDQQFGGLIMWVPGGLVYLAAGLWVASRWLRPAPRSVRRPPDRDLSIAGSRAHRPASPPRAPALR